MIPITKNMQIRRPLFEIENEIIRVISQHTPASARDVEKAYRTTGSYDKAVLMVDISGCLNASMDYILGHFQF